MQTKYKILRVDDTHPLLDELLLDKGLQVDVDLTSPAEKIMHKIVQYDGLIIRSRFPVDKKFLEKAKNLKFICRVGSGLDNIDKTEAQKRNIQLINTPEGNADAVGELAVGLLISLLRHIPQADRKIRQGIWSRFTHTGTEIQGKTIGLIGYGNTGKAFAKRLSGFGAEVIFYDILPGLEDTYAKQVDMGEIFERSDILSLHIPLDKNTKYLVNKDYLLSFKKPIYLLNTSRGPIVKTEDLADMIQKGKVLGAGLDVLEYEKTAFQNEQWDLNELPPGLKYLLQSDRVVFTPHIGALTRESYERLARIAAEKIIRFLEGG